MRSLRLLTLALVTLPLLTTWPVIANAADIPMYDQNTSRTRYVHDPSFSPTTLYLSSPVDVHLPGQSISTPTVVTTGAGTILYQYTYSGATGTLYAIKMPTVNTQDIIERHGYDLPSHLEVQPQILDTLTFRPAGGAVAADAQDSLATNSGWQAIAVGDYLYAWPQGDWPSSPSASTVRVKIVSALGNTQKRQVDMNPLITPPLPVKVTNVLTRTHQTLQVPLVVACSWDGGCAAEPLGLPGYDASPTVSYDTTRDFPSDSQAAITSDPVYIASEPLLGGDPAVVFGVASWSHPRIELLDLLTGRAKAIGGGKIGAAISDAGMLAYGALVYHDIYGNIYEFGLNGSLLNKQPSGLTSPIYARDSSLSYAYFTGSAGTDLQPWPGNSEVATAPVTAARDNATGTIGTFENPSSPSTVKGGTDNVLCAQGSYIPSSQCSFVSAWSYDDGPGNGPGIMLDDAATGSAYSNGHGMADAGQLLSASVEPYVGVLLDAGPEQDLLSWSNATPVGGALEFWAPVKYGVLASAPSSASSGATVTVTAKPVPSGVTHDRLYWHPCHGADANPMQIQLTSSLGSSGYLTMKRTSTSTVSEPWSMWSASFTLPKNATGSAVTWTGTVTAVDKYCSTANATVTISETSSPKSPRGPQTPAAGNGLVLSPNPALYGQTVVASLAPATPQAPTVPSGDNLVKWTWQITGSPTLTWPKRPSAWAFAYPVVATATQSEAMTVASGGQSATAKFVEDWWDGGCKTQVAGATSCITDELQGGGSYIPAHDWSVAARYTITEAYTYEYPKMTWSSNPACKTDNPPSDCNAKGETPTTTWLTKDDSVTLPAASAQVTLNTDGTSIRRVGGG